MATVDEKILAASLKHPIVVLPEGQLYKYGTAGFRMKSDLLDGVTFRVGLLAALRTRKLGSQTIGVMITASHNPAADNGIKLVDPMGEMLEQEWETHATRLVNCKSDQELVDTFKALAVQLKVDLSAPGRVIYGRDTRPSGHGLIIALSDALKATDTETHDYKLITTPILHYLTRCVNTEGTPLAYGKVSEVGYYEKLSEAFVRSLRGKKVQGQLIVDCSNGIGAPKFAEFLKYVSSEVTGLNVKIVNDDVIRPEVLNFEVSHSLYSLWYRQRTACRQLLTFLCSAEPTMSNPSNEPQLPRSRFRVCDAAPSTAMLTVSSTTG